MERKTKIRAGVAVLAVLLTICGTAIVALAHPPQPEGTVRVFKGAVIVSLNAVDSDSGVNYTSISVYFRKTTADMWAQILAPTHYTGNITYSAQGRYQVHYFSVDNAGNIEAEKTQTFLIWQDTLAPTTALTLTGDEIVPT
jgi:hypothetical protein